MLRNPQKKGKKGQNIFKYFSKTNKYIQGSTGGEVSLNNESDIITQNLDEECTAFDVQDDCSPGPSTSKKSCYSDGDVIEENQLEPSEDTAGAVEENMHDTIYVVYHMRLMYFQTSHLQL